MSFSPLFTNVGQPKASCPTAPKISADCLCLEVSLPPLAVGQIIDINWNGAAEFKDTALNARPNDPNWKKQIFRIGDPVNYPLPIGVTYDAATNRLFFQTNVKVGEKWAIWTPPTAQSTTCGSWIWTATALCVTFKSGPCEEIIPTSVPSYNSYCLTATPTTSPSLALASLQAAYTDGIVTLAYDGSALSRPSQFQFTGVNPPAPANWAGNSNLPSAIWNYGVCQFVPDSAVNPQQISAAFNAMGTGPYNDSLPVQIFQEQLNGSYNIFEIEPAITCPNSFTEQALAPDFSFKTLRATALEIGTFTSNSTIAIGDFDVIIVTANNITLTINPPVNNCSAKIMKLVITDPTFNTTLIPGGAFTIAGSAVAGSISGAHPFSSLQGRSVTLFWNGSNVLFL